MLFFYCSAPSVRTFPLTWDLSGPVTAAEVKLYAFPDSAIKGDTVSMGSYWGLHSWNLDTIMWGRPRGPYEETHVGRNQGWKPPAGLSSQSTASTTPARPALHHFVRGPFGIQSSCPDDAR